MGTIHAARGIAQEAHSRLVRLGRAQSRAFGVSAQYWRVELRSAPPNFGGVGSSVHHCNMLEALRFETEIAWECVSTSSEKSKTSATERKSSRDKRVLARIGAGVLAWARVFVRIVLWSCMLMSTAAPDEAAPSASQRRQGRVASGVDATYIQGLTSFYFQLKAVI
eukprot:24500-Pleurochrysis_carterae.AAC.2